MFEQVPSPLVLVGDFNAPLATWGSHRTNNSLLITHGLLLKNKLVFSNTGASTLFSVGNDVLSAIGLLNCSTGLSSHLRRECSKTFTGVTTSQC